MWLQQEGSIINLDAVMQVSLDLETVDDEDIKREKEIWFLNFYKADGELFDPSHTYAFDEEEYNKGVEMLAKLAKAIQENRQIINADELYDQVLGDKLVLRKR